TGVGLSFLGHGFALWKACSVTAIAFARHRYGNAFRRRRPTYFGLCAGRMEWFRSYCGFTSLSACLGLLNNNRCRCVCRVRLAPARRPDPSGRNLCLRQSIGGGFTRLLLGPGADNASNFVRGDTDSWLGDLGERAWAPRWAGPPLIILRGRDARRAKLKRLNYKER